MKVSIHQPVYLPWAPYFGKIAMSESFVFLDDVQYPGGKSFFNRNVIKGANNQILLTVPVKGRSNLPLVKDLQVDALKGWQENHWKTIKLSYLKAPYYPLYQDEFQDLYLKKKWVNLSDFNIELITLICNLIGIKTRLYRSSELDLQPNYGLNKILDIIGALQADQYITGAGEGSLRYMNEAEYSLRNIDVFWYRYYQSEYPQLWSKFTPNLSMLDMLFNCGPNSMNLLINNSNLSNENEG
jgi:hypothetical protein